MGQGVGPQGSKKGPVGMKASEVGAWLRKRAGKRDHHELRRLCRSARLPMAAFLDRPVLFGQFANGVRSVSDRRRGAEFLPFRLGTEAASEAVSPTTPRQPNHRCFGIGGRMRRLRAAYARPTNRATDEPPCAGIAEVWIRNLTLDP